MFLSVYRLYFVVYVVGVVVADVPKSLDKALGYELRAASVRAKQNDIQLVTALTADIALSQTALYDCGEIADYLGLDLASETA